MPLDKPFARVSNLQPHTRFKVPTVVLALKKVVKKLPLHSHTVIGVEGRPMRAPMGLEPLLLRRSADEPLHVAAQMQALTAPIGG